MAASPSISSGIGRRLLADGLLTQEQISIEYESGSRLRIIKKFDQTGLRSESIYDEEQKVHIERKFDCGLLLEETKEALTE